MDIGFNCLVNATANSYTKKILFMEPLMANVQSGY